MSYNENENKNTHIGGILYMINGSRNFVYLSISTFEHSTLYDCVSFHYSGILQYEKMG